MRSVYWFGRNEVQRAVESSKQNECRLVVPSIQPNAEAPMLRPQWKPKLHGKVPVVQSEHFQLSHTSTQSPQEPHWHRLQVETYHSDSPMIVVSVDIDERLRDTPEIKLDVIPAGRVFIPPRFCHVVHLTGPTEVMQLRVEPGSLDRDDYFCDDCQRDKCRCDEMREMMKKAVAEHAGELETKKE